MIFQSCEACARVYGFFEDRTRLCTTCAESTRSDAELTKVTVALKACRSCSCLEYLVAKTPRTFNNLVVYSVMCVGCGLLEQRCANYDTAAEPIEGVFRFRVDVDPYR